MKHTPLLWILTFVFASIQLQVRAAASAETIWKRVQFAMSYMAPEKFERLTSAAIQERYRDGIKKFDASMKEFVATAPNDPRLWEAKVFDAVRLFSLRKQAGFPPPAEGEAMNLVEEALKAPDATTAAKAMASAYKLTQLALDTRDGTFPRDEWMRMADAHFKDYPGNNRENDILKNWQVGMRATMDLMALPPLDFKLTSVEGTEVDLAKMRGKVVLLFFWDVSNEDFDVRMRKIVRDTYQKHHTNGFEVIGIPLGADKPKLVKFLKQSGTPWPQILEARELKMQYKKVNPLMTTMFLFDKKGMLVRSYVRETLPEEVEKFLME